MRQFFVSNDGFLSSVIKIAFNDFLKNALVDFFSEEILKFFYLFYLWFLERQTEDKKFFGNFLFENILDFLFFERFVVVVGFHDGVYSLH